MNHDDCAGAAELAPAAALGALDPDEAAYLRAHLATCARQHPDVHDANALAAAIGDGLPDEDMPSPTLRARLLERVRTEAARILSR